MFVLTFGRNVLRLAIVAVLAAPLLAGCSGGGGVGSSGVKRAAFSAKEFGVAVSPRATRAKYPPRGGGRYLARKPYVVAGVTYQPVEGPGYVARGKASWYGHDFHGRRTANGEIFGAFYLTAASPVLPVPSYARVTNLENGRSILVRVNDRGPYLKGRIIDLSYGAASILGYLDRGSADVEVRYVGPAPLSGDDTRMLRASVNRLTPYEREREVLFAMSADDAPLGAPIPESRIGSTLTAFGYADTTGAGEAEAAAAALAVGSLADQETDTDHGAVRLQLGRFEDYERAVQAASEFAVLGAVEEDYGDHGVGLALTHLKPGARIQDVFRLARELGLKAPILY
jgi:rare lipoprotein A